MTTHDRRQPDPPAAGQVRPMRRVTDGGPHDSPRARQGRLVRHIASDPVLLGWLATTKARTLQAVAASLTTAGYSEAAELVRQHADRIASHEVSPFA